ncbi:MAG: hypothetical protein PHQ40_19660 [Anaerolineaceae bacterium]|nr:hypothetical protein [Anaerolineaceae bacterium]
MHTYTLGAIYAGLCGTDNLVHLGLQGVEQERVNQAANSIQGYIRNYLVRSGRLIKSMDPLHPGPEAGLLALQGVDASLIGLCTPYQVFPQKDATFQATVAAIEQHIHRPGGGVYRYLGDTYYGGGEWLLLAAWLGWFYAQAGKRKEAQTLREWIESKVDAEGFLPEQVNDHALAPSYYDPWLKKWGPVASPLLWSHAMYIILVNAIQADLAQ